MNEGKNIGDSDRMIRLIMAILVGIVVSSHLVAGVLAMTMMLTGLFLSITSLFCFDPLYNFLKINSRRTKLEKEKDQ